VTPLDSAAGIGELLSWVGLGMGVPLLLIGWGMRHRDGAWLPVSIVVAPGPRGAVARWYTGGDFHERRLRHDEAHLRAGEHDALVSSRDARRMRLHPPAVPRTLLLVGGILCIVGVVGFALSLLPLLG
jgi:hypothetical protein